MSECENNFIKVAVPVNSLPVNASETDKDIARQYVYDDNETSKIDICVKKCNSGSIPLNPFDIEPTKKIEFTLKSFTHGVEFGCFDNPSTDFIKNNGIYNIIYTCSAGILNPDEMSGDPAKCAYRPDQYILRRGSQ
jgi:hypothetical protein